MSRRTSRGVAQSPRAVNGGTMEVCSRRGRDASQENPRIARRKPWARSAFTASQFATGCAERPGQVGLSHHRWLIDIDGQHIRFLPKYHMIHADWRFHLPSNHLRRLSREACVQWLWWDGRFDFEEITIHGLQAMEAELQRFAQHQCPRPAWVYQFDRVMRNLAHTCRRATSWAMRRALQ